MGHYAKFIVAVLGAVATTVITVFGAGTTAGQVATIVLAAVTAGAVYVVPNGPAVVSTAAHAVTTPIGAPPVA